MTTELTRRGLLGLGLAGASALLLPPTARAASTYPSPRGTSVVFAPHADDDVLGFGGYIAAQRAAGNEVYVVLYTDGIATGVCGADTFDHGTCSNAQTGWAGHSTDELIAARNAEFRAACAALGVPDNHVWIGTPVHAMTHDSQTTIAAVRDHMRWFQQRIPDATYVAYSWIDSHVDHRNGGLALRSMVEDNLLDPAQAVFALAPWYWQWTIYPAANAHDVQAANQLRTTYGRPDDAHLFTAPTRAQTLQDAARAYYPVDGQPRSGVGYASVPSYLDAWRDYPASLLHTYASSRYSTRVALSTLGGSGTSRQASGTFRLCDYPGAGSDPAANPLGTVQGLVAARIDDPGRGQTVTVTSYSASGTRLAATALVVGTGGAWSGTVAVPTGTATVRATFAGSAGMGPATSDTTNTSIQIKRKVTK